MIIQNNLIANFTSRQLGINSKYKQKSMEKLQSGYQINRAADDAAHLSISEQMRSQIRGLDQADRNIQDGISLLQTADGALGEVHSILHRMGELAVQSANDTNTEEDRNALNQEYLSLRKEINRIAKETEFNTKQLLYDNTITVGGNPDDVTVYTNDAGKYAGIVYNKVRYDWSQFISETSGATMADAATKAGSYYLDTVNGHRLHFTIDKGSDIPYLCKKYDIKADTSNITIDDYDVEWWNVRDEDGVAINTAKPHAGFYQFTYYGSAVGFTVSEGDTFEDILTMLNDTAEGNSHTWVSQLDIIGSHEAVYNLDPLESSVGITMDNKANVDKPPYTINADSSGIWISGYDSATSGTVNYAKVAWSDLTFVPDYYGSNQGVDFSTGSGIGDFTNVTFSCKDTGISFDFQISDEASMESVINGLNGITIPTILNTPVTGAINLNTTIDPSATPPKNPVMTGASVSGLNLSFETQRDALKLDFENSYWTGTSSQAGLQLQFGLGSGDSSFTLDSSQMNALKSFFQNGSTNGIELTFVNDSSDSIRINFIRSSNISDSGRPKSADYDINDYNTAMNNYVYQKLTDFTTQLANSAMGIRSVNAELAVSDFDVTSISAGNSSMAPLYKVKPKEVPPLNVQVGANSEQNIDVAVGRISSISLGLGGAIISTREGASNCIDMVNNASEIISSERAKVGANENRLAFAQSIAQNGSEQLQDAESKIRDTDIPAELVKLAKYNVLEQAAQSILTQANQSAQQVLNLLK
jgi:flagellin